MRTACTRPVSTVWVSARSVWPSRQSKLANASISTGAPVSSVPQSPVVKRSGTRAEEANCAARSRCFALSTLTQKTRLCSVGSCAPASRLTQASSIGGAALSEQTAVAVKPMRRSPMEVVTMVTPAASRRMPSLKLSESIATTGAVRESKSKSSNSDIHPSPGAAPALRPSAAGTL